MLTKEEEQFLNDLTALMIRHNIIFVSDEFDNYSIIDANHKVNLDILYLYEERIGAERYE